MKTKICKGCNVLLPITDFSPSNGSHKSRCRPCAAKHGAQLRRKNHAQYRKYERDYYARNREQRLKDKRKYNHRINGIPAATRPVPASCECCGRIFDATRYGGPRLDHDHKTGKFRGWLCDNCNRGIGVLGDTLTKLREAVSYLERAQ